MLFREIVISGVDPEAPGLYEWIIEGSGVYIGQYKCVSRPRTHYTRNVNNLLAGRPYRKGKPQRFRAIHHNLAKAVRDGREVTMALIENVPDKAERNKREREVIASRRAAGLTVLNGN